MLKIKPILIGVALQMASFFLLACIITFVALRMGGISNNSYILCFEFASYMSVVLGAFIASRLAWEKGGVYGTIVGAFWVLVRLIFFIVFSAVFNFMLFVNIFIILAVAFVSGALAVTIKSYKY